MNGCLGISNRVTPEEAAPSRIGVEGLTALYRAENRRAEALSWALPTDELALALSKKQAYEDVFAAELDRAIAYAEAHPESDYTDLMLDDFPVVFGVSLRAAFAGTDINTLGWLRWKFYGSGEMHEFRPQASSLELGGDLPVIGVPQNKVEKVQCMLQRKKFDAVVLPIESLRTS